MTGFGWEIKRVSKLLRSSSEENYQKKLIGQENLKKKKLYMTKEDVALVGHLPLLKV